MSRYQHYVTRRALTLKQCRTVIDYLEENPIGLQSLIKNDKDGQLYLDLDYEAAEYQWLYQKIEALAFDVNDKHWVFDLDGWQQELRVSRYSAGAGMGWHLDHIDTDESKLAFSIALNSPSEYTNGEFRMLETPPIPRLESGKGIFFPAYHGHMVNPVTWGDRYVLLGWLTGPRFI